MKEISLIKSDTACLNSFILKPGIDLNRLLIAMFAIIVDNLSQFSLPLHESTVIVEQKFSED